MEVAKVAKFSNLDVLRLRFPEDWKRNCTRRTAPSKTYVSRAMPPTRRDKPGT